jgi:chorismate mutase
MPPGADGEGAPPRTVRAVRGATVVHADTPAAVHDATVAASRAIVARNALRADDVVSACSP